MSNPSACVVAARDGEEIQRCVVGAGSHIIGRAAECGIPVDDKQMSRRHACLTIGDGGWMIEDLGSANGTHVDGQRVNGRVRVAPGQRIRLGSVQIEVEHVFGGAADTTVADVSAVSATVAVKAERMSAVTEPGRLSPDAPVALRSWLDSIKGRDKYDVGRVVARGGMGAVFSAKEAATGRTVAMKRILDSADEESGARFLTEAKVTALLEHPNIVPVHDLDVDARGRVFYTMKLIKGETLGDVLERIEEGDEATIRQYPLGELLNIFQKVCDAVAFAHSRDVLHRDLKPDNIMIGEYGEVLVMDWGLAKILARRLPRRTQASSLLEDDPSDGFHTMDGMVIGTPQYMAPEQAEGHINQIDQRTDIYALGGILYHMLTLRPPVLAGNDTAMIKAAAAGEIPPPAELVKKVVLPHSPGGRVPGSLSAVAMRALSKARSGRYPTVQSLRQEVVAYQTGFATSAEHAGTWRKAELLLRRHKVAAAVFLMVLALATAAMVGVMLSERRVRASDRRAEEALRKLAEIEATEVL